MPHESSELDAVVVGSGPNGLAAAITLASAGWRVRVYEGRATVGGGLRTLELTEPGFYHDICSAIHPLGIGSPFFQKIDLAAHGLTWIQPALPLAHPLDAGPALVLHRDLARTARGLGMDGEPWRRLMAGSVQDWPQLAEMFLGPWPKPSHPRALLRFGPPALLPAETLARIWFRTMRGRALFAGLAAHAIQPLQWPLTASFGLMLGILAHTFGWPLPRGGSQSIADAMVAHLIAQGGEVATGTWVKRLTDLPPARAVLLDITPRQLLALAGDQLPPGYRRQLQGYRYGAGVCKVDFALREAVPWRDATCAQAGTLHLGGTLAEISRSESLVWEGRHAAQPYVLVSQPSLFDPTRAPAGQHTLWAYCHVPHGSQINMSAAIEAQLERFAPGFGDVVISKRVHTAAEMAEYNPNYVGGDINGGVQDWRQLWTRPTPRLHPYTTPLENVYLCSSATPPGGGVHGMAGYHAARAVLAAAGQASPL